MKIFVISLESAYDRRSVMTEQMRRLGLEFEFLNAVNGKQLSDDVVATIYDPKWAYRNEGRYLSRGEIGCFASHQKVFERVIGDNIPFALILEDDAWLTPSIVGILNRLDEILSADKNEVYLLQEMRTGSFKKKGKIISVIGDLFVLKEVLSACWAHAYVVTNTSAKSLIKALTPMQRPLDCWGWLVRHRIVTVYCMNRTLSTQNMFNLPSNIGFERFEKNKWFWGGLTHKAYRAFWLAYDLLTAQLKRCKSWIK